MKKAVIVVDMQKDNVGRFCRHIIPNIKRLVEEARKRGFLVVYGCDSRYPDDFLFKRLGEKPRTIRGTKGVEVIDELAPEQGDVVVEKRMLSVFFGTDLDFTLRHRGVSTIIVTGIITEGCVLKTALDGFELGYEVIVPRDCCASLNPSNHEATFRILEVLKIPSPTLEELLERGM